MLHSGRDVLTNPIDRAADHGPELPSLPRWERKARPRPGLPLDGATEVSRPAVADAVVAAAAGDRGAFEEYHRTRRCAVRRAARGDGADRGLTAGTTPSCNGLLHDLSAAQRAENRRPASKEPAGVASDSFKAA